MQSLFIAISACPLLFEVKMSFGMQKTLTDDGVAELWFPSEEGRLAKYICKFYTYYVRENVLEWVQLKVQGQVAIGTAES